MSASGLVYDNSLRLFKRFEEYSYWLRGRPFKGLKAFFSFMFRMMCENNCIREIARVEATRLGTQ